MSKRVVVTGLGIISPIGNDVDTFWNNIKNGVSGIDYITYFDASAFDSKIAGQVKDFDPINYGVSKKEANRMEKFIAYAVASAKQALDDSGMELDKEDRERIGVAIGSGIGSLHVMEDQHNVYLKSGPSRLTPFLIPMLIVNEAAGHVAIMFGLKGPNTCITTACASGSHCIGDAYEIIQRGDAEVMVAGGTEGCLTPLGVGGFCALKGLSTRNDEPKRASRPFDAERNGFVIAEGCGLVVLEDLEHAEKRGARIYAEIVGYGMSGDAYHITAPAPSGEGPARAMKAALKDAKLNPEDVDYINAHGTSTKLNDKIETAAVKLAFGEHSKKVMMSSTKSMTGHLLGAAGGAEFVACALAIKDQVAPPTINYENPDPECDIDCVANTARNTPIRAAMSNSLGFGGHNASLIIKQFK